MKRCDSELKHAILILIIININIIGNVSNIGPHNVTLRFLGNGYKKGRRKIVLYFYIKQSEIDLS